MNSHILMFGYSSSQLMNFPYITGLKFIEREKDVMYRRKGALRFARSRHYNASQVILNQNILLNQSYQR